MWLLEFLPDWIFHIILLGGLSALVLSFVARMIPVISKYQLPLLIGGIAITTIGVYFEGAISNEDKWKMRVAEAEKQVLELQAQSAKANTQLESKANDKVRVIRDVQLVIQKEIVEQAAKIDADCRLPKEAIDLHNKAATTPQGIK